MSPYSEIDELDFDIQGSELRVINDPVTMNMINQKVRLVHFGTHGLSIERKKQHPFNNN